MKTSRPASAIRRLLELQAAERILLLLAGFAHEQKDESVEAVGSVARPYGTSAEF